uniref:Uncharacterized protein n=1 Tax=Rhizophora mucronata TaxID=61149 RepID=A0A2P2IMB2_RHIMU
MVINLGVDMIRVRRGAVSRQAKGGTNIGNSRLEFLHGEATVSVFVQLLELMIHEAAKHLLVPNQLHYI